MSLPKRASGSMLSVKCINLIASQCARNRDQVLAQEAMM